MSAISNLLRFQSPPWPGRSKGDAMPHNPVPTGLPNEDQRVAPVGAVTRPTPPSPATDPKSPGTAAKKSLPARLVSLDAFRGLTILGMLLVNNIALGDRVPKQLLHAEWSGEVHMADLVFPWFLFIVGVALPYSVASARRKHLEFWKFDLKALWRAGALIFLGCMINSFEQRHFVFGLDVLQLIGLAFMCAVLIGGLFRLPGRLAVAALLLVANWYILKRIPIPGYGAGHFTEHVNSIDYINSAYLSHYNLKGLLSVIPTTAMVLIGTGVGDLMRRKQLDSIAKVAVLLLCGAGLVAIGWMWSSPALGTFALPMNKPCWSASYILYCAGWATIGLGIMYALVDTTPGKWGAIATFPLIVFGMNAIVAYCLPILTKVAILRNIDTTWPTGHTMNAEEALRQWFFQEFGRYNGGWTYTVAYIGFFWCILLILHRKRWFLRV